MESDHSALQRCVDVDVATVCDAVDRKEQYEPGVVVVLFAGKTFVAGAAGLAVASVAGQESDSAAQFRFRKNDARFADERTEYWQ